MIITSSSRTKHSTALVLLLVLFSLALMVQCKSKPKVPKEEMHFAIQIPENITKSVTLKLDQGYFVADADLLGGDKNKTIKDIPEAERGKLAIALYTKASFLSKSCPEFSPYVPKPNSVKLLEPQQNSKAQFTKFEADGNLGSANIVLDLDKFITTPSQEILVATSCTPAGKKSKNVNGIIGMGRASKNVAGPQFGVVISDELNTAELIFDPDLRYSILGDVNFDLKADAEWKVSGSFQTLLDGKIKDYGKKTLIFDINTEKIILPQALFEDFNNTIHEKGAHCSYASKGSITCAYRGLIEDLPVIGMRVDYHSIMIRPEVYVRDGFNLNKNMVQSFDLSILPGSSKNDIDAGYVNPVFENDIILGASFMQSFFTLFDSSTGRISLYDTKTREIVIKGKPRLKLVMENTFLVFALLGIVALCCVSAILNRLQRKEEMRIKAEKERLLAEQEGVPEQEGLNSGELKGQKNSKGSLVL